MLNPKIRLITTWLAGGQICTLRQCLNIEAKFMQLVIKVLIKY